MEGVLFYQLGYSACPGYDFTRIFTCQLVSEMQFCYFYSTFPPVRLFYSLAELSEILDNSFMVQTSSCHLLLFHCNVWNRFPAIVFILHDDNGHIELMMMLAMLSWI